MAIHSNILSWRIPLPEVPGRLQSLGSHRVEQYWSNLVLKHANIKSLHNSTGKKANYPNGNGWNNEETFNPRGYTDGK